MNKALALAALAVLAAAGGAAQAGEDRVALKAGADKDVVEANCIGCHSLDYILMNSPFLDAKGWTAEVTKMMKAFGAPVPEAEAPKIAAYLAANYGKK